MKLALLLLGTLLLLLLFSGSLDAEHHRHHRGHHGKEASNQEEAVTSGHKHHRSHGQKSKHHHHGKASGHEHGKKDSKHSSHHRDHSKDMSRSVHLDTHHYSHHKPCNQKIPGIDKMAKGVDINSLDLFPSDKTAANGFLNTIFEFTCDRHFTYTDPTSKKVYQRPDQVQSISSNPSGSETVITSIHDTLDDVRSSMAVKAGVDLKAGPFSFSASGSYREAKSTLIVKKQRIAETSEFRTCYVVEFKDAEQMRLSTNFTKALKSLPSKFTESPEKYQKFLATFGTHYFKVASFGGSLYSRTAIDSTYAKTISEHQMRTHLETKFKLGFIKAKSSSTSEESSHKETETFEQKTQTTFHYFGGKTNPQSTDNHGVNQWYATVNEDPWLYAGRLAPMVELIPDKRKRKQIEIAILLIGLKKAIEDLENTIHLTTFQGTIQESLLRKKLNNVTHYVNRPKEVKGSAEVEEKCQIVKMLGKKMNAALSVVEEGDRREPDEQLMKYIKYMLG